MPLTQWEDGTIRISGTRVTLDVIIHQFKLGATAEQIHDSFPAASLQDIYGAIYYYLTHTEAVNVYMREQQKAAADTRQWAESQPGNRRLRERLLARRQLPNSSAGQAVLYARLKKHGIIPLSVWRPRSSWGGEKTWRVYAGV
jgi:uncharacterized protein (DUF433 family)